MEAALPAIVEDIAALVRTESPTDDLEAVARSADVVAGLGERRLGAAPERITVDGCSHLRWDFGSGPRSVLLLAHHDTVWPLGSLDTHPFSVSENGILRGPGCFDMKSGLVLAFHALAALGTPDGVTLLVTGDEEIGSPTSRALIESAAAGCRAALVLEAAADGGALKTARKGTSLYTVTANGKAAHSGLEPERGVNATVELAHQIQAVAALSSPDTGTTVTPTRLSAGTTINTVPASGSFTVDGRMWSVSEQERVDAAMRALQPAVPGASLSVAGGPNRPPFPASASAGLFARARALAPALGLGTLPEAAVGGASDGNFTAGIGVPTLDGLGAVGGGAHADSEHVVVAELPGRAALLAALVTDVLRN